MGITKFVCGNCGAKTDRLIAWPVSRNQDSARRLTKAQLRSMKLAFPAKGFVCTHCETVNLLAQIGGAIALPEEVGREYR